MLLNEFVTNPPHCVFCGTTTGPFSEEDVFPKWFRKTLPPGKFFRVRNRPDTLGLRVDNVMKLALDRAVCLDCNTGWMSRLESRVKGLIAPAMLAQRRITLYTPEQNDIAAWAVQKALMLDLAASQRVPSRPLAYVTHEHLAWLYEHREPPRLLPPGSSVWLFVNDASKRAVGRGLYNTAWAHLIVPLVPVDKEGATESDVCGVLSTFTFAFLGIQVFLRDLDELVERLTPPIPPLLRSLTTRVGSGVLPTTRWPKTKAHVSGETAFVSLAIWDGVFADPAGYWGYRGYKMTPQPQPEVLRPPHLMPPGRSETA